MRGLLSKLIGLLRENGLKEKKQSNCKGRIDISELFFLNFDFLEKDNNVCFLTDARVQLVFNRFNTRCVAGLIAINILL